jgi:hypothetical protein
MLKYLINWCRYYTLREKLYDEFRDAIYNRNWERAKVLTHRLNRVKHLFFK